MFSPLARGCGSWTGELCRPDSEGSQLPSLSSYDKHHRHGVTVSRCDKSSFPTRTTNFHEKLDGELVLPKTFITKKGALLLFTVPDEIEFSDEQRQYLRKAQKLLKNRYAKYSGKFGKVSRLAQSVLLFGDEDYEHEGTSITDPDNKAFFKFIHGLDHRDVDLKAQPGGDLEFYLRDLKSRATSGRTRVSTAGTRSAWSERPGMAELNKPLNRSESAPPSHHVEPPTPLEAGSSDGQFIKPVSQMSLSLSSQSDRVGSAGSQRSYSVLSADKLTASLRSTHGYGYQENRSKSPIQESQRELSSRRSSLSLPRSPTSSHKARENEVQRPGSALSRSSHRGASMSHDHTEITHEKKDSECRSPVHDVSTDAHDPLNALSDPDSAHVVGASRSSVEDNHSRSSSVIDSRGREMEGGDDDDVVSVASSLLNEEDIPLDDDLDQAPMEVIVEVGENEVHLSDQRVTQSRVSSSDHELKRHISPDDRAASIPQPLLPEYDVSPTLLSGTSEDEGTFILGAAFPEAVNKSDIVMEDTSPSMLSHRQSLASIHSNLSSAARRSEAQGDGPVSGHSSRPSSVRSQLSAGQRSRTPAPAPPSSPSDSRATTPAVPTDRSEATDFPTGQSSAANAPVNQSKDSIAHIVQSQTQDCNESLIIQGDDRETESVSGQMDTALPEGNIQQGVKEEVKVNMKTNPTVGSGFVPSESGVLKGLKSDQANLGVQKTELQKSDLIPNKVPKKPLDVTTGKKSSTHEPSSIIKSAQGKADKSKKISKPSDKKEKQFTSVFDISNYESPPKKMEPDLKSVIKDTNGGVGQLPHPPSTSKRDGQVQKRASVAQKPTPPPRKTKQEEEVERLEKEVSEILTTDRDADNADGEDGGLTIEELELEQKILQQKMEMAQDKLAGKKDDKKARGKTKEKKTKKKKDTSDAELDLAKQREALREARKLEKQRQLEQAKKLEEEIKKQDDERKKQEAEAEMQKQIMKEEMEDLEAEEEATRQAEEDAREALAEARKMAREEREKRRKEDIERKKAEAQRRRERERKMTEEGRRKEREMLEKIADAEMRKKLIEEDRIRQEEEEEMEEERKEDEERLAKLQADQEEERIAMLELQAEEEAMQRLVKERQEKEARRLALQAEARKIAEEEEKQRQMLLMQQQKLEEERRLKEEEENRKRQLEMQRLAELQRLEDEAREQMRAEVDKRRESALRRREQNLERRGHLERTRQGQGVTKPWVFSYYVNWPRETYERLMGDDPNKKKGFRSAGRPRPKPQN